MAWEKGVALVSCSHCNVVYHILYNYNYISLYAFQLGTSVYSGTLNGPLVSRLKHVTKIWACHKIDSIFREKLVSTAAEKVGC